MNAHLIRDNLWLISGAGEEDIKFCAPAGVATASQVLALYQSIAAAAPAEAPCPTTADYADAIQAYLDAKAGERHYDSMQSAISYRGDLNPHFAAEAEALFTWRSAVWTYATAELAKVEAGQRPLPGIEEFVGEQPAFVWP